MRYLDQDLIDKYQDLPKSGKSIMVGGVRTELGYDSPWSWISRIMTKKVQPKPDQYSWLKTKIEELYAYYHPEAEDTKPLEEETV